MTRKLAFVATLAVILATAACADATGPNSGCQITSGSNNCIPTPPNPK